MSKKINISVLQLNFKVDNIHENARRIIENCWKLYQNGVQLAITPELALSGYAAEDWYLRADYLEQCQQAFNDICHELRKMPNFSLVLGHPQAIYSDTNQVINCFNVASIISTNGVVAQYKKRILPNWEVFDEQRYFKAGSSPLVVDIHGIKIGLLICEDSWSKQLHQENQALGAKLLVILNASPYSVEKYLLREQLMAEACQLTNTPIIYAQLVGSQDELIFDGGSFAMNAYGKITARAPFFKENILMLDLSDDNFALSGPLATPFDFLAELWQALVFGIREYVMKKNFTDVCFGLSGGIDSALVYALSIDALGKNRVHPVMMFTQYNAKISLEDAKTLTQNLGSDYTELNIQELFENYCQLFKSTLNFGDTGLAYENIQARIRGNILMALSNERGYLILTTGNKSELATGYCTLYGDTAGGFAPIKDLKKTIVYSLVEWRNQNDPFRTGANPIPERIITRPPSAELKYQQSDQDSLPDYAILDAIIKHYVEELHSLEYIVSLGYDLNLVNKIISMIVLNEYKRKQMPLGLRVTNRSFGKDWRFPITTRSF